MKILAKVWIRQNQGPIMAYNDVLLLIHPPLNPPPSQRSMQAIWLNWDMVLCLIYTFANIRIKAPITWSRWAELAQIPVPPVSTIRSLVILLRVLSFGKLYLDSSHLTISDAYPGATYFLQL